MNNLNQFISQYLFYCEHYKGLNPKTIKAYRIDLAQFAAFMQTTDCELNRDNISAYIIHLHQNFKIKSIKRKVASVKAFFNYLEYEELWTANPFTKMRIKLHEPSLLPRTIPFSSIETIIHCAYQKENNGQQTPCEQKTTLRDIAVLELLFATGIRVSELCSLTIGAVDFNDGTIKIYGKGSKERIIQIGNEQVLDSLVRYYNAYQVQIEETGCFFINRLGKQLSDQSVRSIINKYTRLAKVDMHITPHMFRHSFATLLLEEDVDIRYIQQLLGHSSIVTTQIYTHVTSKKQRDLLVAKHPRNKMDI